MQRSLPMRRGPASISRSFLTRASTKSWSHRLMRSRVPTRIDEAHSLHATVRPRVSIFSVADYPSRRARLHFGRLADVTYNSLTRGAGETRNGRIASVFVGN